jgi:hypothetical protein
MVGGAHLDWCDHLKWLGLPVGWHRPPAASFGGRRHAPGKPPGWAGGQTGWRENRRKAWLWVVVTSLGIVFRVVRSRAGSLAKDLLGGEPKAIVTSDPRRLAPRWAPGLELRIGVPKRQTDVPLD